MHQLERVTYVMQMMLYLQQQDRLSLFHAELVWSSVPLHGQIQMLVPENCEADGT